MGVKRGLFWNFILECAPISWDGVEWATSLLCDWVTLPARSWPDVGEVSLEDLPQRNLLEASFYLSAHHVVRLNRLEIAHGQGNCFRIRIGGDFDLEGYDELDGHAIPIDTFGSVRFKGLIVMPENVFPKPRDVAGAIAVAQQFLDLETFAAPEWDGSRFLFEPRPAAV